MNRQLKRIALVTCASNFERYGNIVRFMRRKLQQLGGCVLYVISSYSVFVDGSGMEFGKGDSAIYQLLDTLELDGCILEVNLSSNVLTGQIVEKLRRRGIPALTINLEAEGVPYLHLETRPACTDLLEHLIVRHGCRRINLALSRGNSVMSQEAEEAYRQVLSRHGIPLDEKRILSTFISVQDGRKLYDRFDARGVMADADAVVCIHDVSAIGLCLELEDRGRRVPEDLRICSLNWSGNSIVFRPQITGLDRMDQEAAETACALMIDMIDGKTIPRENTYRGTVRYVESCGCERLLPDAADIYHRVVINKVEAGKQIGQMMRFNDALEEVESLDQLAANLHEMMQGVGCSSYFCCLNEGDLAYIENGQETDPARSTALLDQRMLLLAGCSDRTGLLSRTPVALKDLTPAVPREGDMFVVLPICHRSRIFGYCVYLNDELPIDVYNFRICQESIGTSIENLHRQMVLRISNMELDRLHMQDQLTGLHNRFAFRRFADQYVSGPYTLAMLDLDGLKVINDRYGHLSGNHAITLAAQAIRSSIREEDLTIRYGGDEFVILSRCVDRAQWERLSADVNRFAARSVASQKLPFPVTVSAGYVISDESHPLSIQEAIEQADRTMYRHKKERREK